MEVALKCAVGLILLFNLSTHHADAMTYSTNENFNSSAIGSAPPTGWTTDTSGGSVSVQAVPDAVNKSLELYKTGTANNAGATRTFAALSGTFTVEARVMVNGLAGYISAPSVGSAVNVYFQDGTINVYNGSTPMTVQEFTAANWYDFRFVVNTVTQKFDFYIDGIEVLTQGAFMNSTPSVSDLWFDIGSGSTGTLCVDDVRVFTDNPPTASYLVNEPFALDTDPADEPPTGWTISGATSSNTVEVVGFPNVYNQSAQIVNTGSGAISTTKTFTQTTGTVVAQANVLAAQTTGELTALSVSSSSGDLAVWVLFSNGSILSYVGGKATTVQSFSANTWYTVKAVINLPANTYDLYIDGCKLLTSAACPHTAVGNLASISFSIGSGNAGTLNFAYVLVFPCTASCPTPIFDPFNFGATGNGTSKDTTALQAAINACAGAGGSVYLHNGTFLAGTITLGSNMTFYIASTATLLGSQSSADYPALTQLPNNSNDRGMALIYEVGQSNLHIDGSGTINGNANIPEWTGPNAVPENQRPNPIYLLQGSNISVKNVYIINGGDWTLVPLTVTNLTLSDIDINDTLDPNRDGIDTCDCTNVLIERCNIFSDDDSICFKGGSSGVQNARVRYCNVGSSVKANGIKYGTATVGGFKDILIEDVNVKNCGRGGISTEEVDGGQVYDVTYRRITLDAVYSPIYIIIGTRTHIGGIDDLHYEAISGSNLNTMTGSPISGVLVSPTTYYLYSLLLSNVDIQYLGGLNSIPPIPPEMGSQYPECNDWGYLPAYGYFIRHANGVTFRDCDTSVFPADARPWIDLDDVQNWRGY
jgi:polygalacturonase